MNLMYPTVCDVSSLRLACILQFDPIHLLLETHKLYLPHWCIQIGFYIRRSTIITAAIYI